MKLEKQTRLWKYAGWTLPFLALAGIVFAYWIDPTTLLNKTIIIICTVFFAVSVFWWWWALDKFTDLIKEKISLAEKFAILSKEIKEMRKDLTNS